MLASALVSDSSLQHGSTLSILGTVWLQSLSVSLAPKLRYTTCTQSPALTARTSLVDRHSTPDTDKTSSKTESACRVSARTVGDTDRCRRFTARLLPATSLDESCSGLPAEQSACQEREVRLQTDGL